MMQETGPAHLDEANEFLTRYASKDLLRFITCGSVDDGKSTLIGRLLLETGAIYSDQIAALRSDSARHGTTQDEIDPALLLDGLEDERQQGITIDVAYRYFHTPRRKFIIADSPGHEQYTRNMATAASTAQAAVILLDARKGLLTQTRRHTFIASLLGINTLILAVNKMDLVAYNNEVFDRLCAEFREFVSRLNVTEIHCVPLSGLRGDNVVRLSQCMPWYHGAALLEVLENVPVGSAAATECLRFPVQQVMRPDADFRGYSGSVAAGVVRPGDRVVVLPSRQQSRVRSLSSFVNTLPSAAAGDAVTITLEDEVDVTRGDLVAHVVDPPMISCDVYANILWMSQQPLVPGKSYWLKHMTRHTTAEVVHVAYRIDVNTLNRVEAAGLKQNEIGFCRVSTNVPLVFDPYCHNRKTGALILVDRVTHETVAAGMIVDPSADALPSGHWDVELASRRLQFTTSKVPASRRHQRYGHPALTILLTGLSGSGKTTIAFELEGTLFQQGRAVTVLDGQNLRHGISRDLGFSAEERSENLRRAAEICRLINDAGMICIAAFVAPEVATREKARQVIGADRFVHVHLTAPLDVCRARDISGRYKAAEANEITNFPGVSVPYEEPVEPDLSIATDTLSIREAVAEIGQLVDARLAKLAIRHIGGVSLD